MSLQMLTDRQRRMIRSLVNGLNNGTVTTDWLIVYGDDTITGIFGLDDDGTLWRTYWDGVSQTDINAFVRAGFMKHGSGGGDSYELLEDAIILAFRTTPT